MTNTYSDKQERKGRGREEGFVVKELQIIREIRAKKKEIKKLEKELLKAVHKEDDEDSIK